MNKWLILLCIGMVLSLSGVVFADLLPNQTPENQIFAIDTVLDITGMSDDQTDLSWLIATPGSIPTGILGTSQRISSVVYRDSIQTNGGHLSENKNFDFDSQNKANGLFNIESEKILTYNSIEGSHLVGEEFAILDDAGNYTPTTDVLRCVFSASPSTAIPSFCNIVKAKSSLININSAQVSTKASIRAVAESPDAPAELNYQIAVTPDAQSGSGFAEGTVSTEFAGHILESRGVSWASRINNHAGSGDVTSDTWNRTAADNAWSDTTAVTGGIKNFQKTFGYQSGIFGPIDPNYGALVQPVG